MVEVVVYCSSQSCGIVDHKLLKIKNKVERRDRNLERKTLLTFCQNIESSLSPKENHCSLKIKAYSYFFKSKQGFCFNLVQDHANNPRLQIKYIQSHIQLRDIKARFKIKLPLNRKASWKSNQRSSLYSSIIKSHTKDCTHIYTNQYKLIICYTIS